MRSIGEPGTAAEQDQAGLAINVIAMVNLTLGHFPFRWAIETTVTGQLTYPDKAARQKYLLHKSIPAMPIN